MRVSPVPTLRAQESPRARQQMEQISYGIGFYLGQEIREGLALDGVAADLQRVVRGFRDGLNQNPPMIPAEELHAILAKVHDEMQRRLVNRLLEEDPDFKQRHDGNLAASRAFREANKKKEGVNTLPSGIQYRVLKPGSGPTPELTDTVVVNVTLSLIDGTQIGSWRGSEVQVGKMVQGGAELLPRMQVGAKWESVIPPELAFGAAGRYPDIGPHQSLVAEVELVAIK